MNYDKTYEGFLAHFPECAENDIFKEPNTCSLCGEEYYGCGNDAAPLVDGRCCDQCNLDRVVPARVEYRVMSEDMLLRKTMNACCDEYGVISDGMSVNGKDYRYVVVFNKEPYACFELFEDATKSRIYLDLKENYIGKLLLEHCSETGYGVIQLEQDEIGALFNTKEAYDWLLPRTKNYLAIKKAA